MASNANVFRHQRVLFLTFAQGQNVGSAGPRSSPLPVLRSGEIHPIGTAAHINANDVPGTRSVRATEGTNMEEVGGTSSYVDVEPDTTRHSPCHHATMPDCQTTCFWSGRKETQTLRKMSYFRSIRIQVTTLVLVRIKSPGAVSKADPFEYNCSMNMPTGRGDKTCQRRGLLK